MKKRLVLAVAILGLCVSLIAPTAGFAKKATYNVKIYNQYGEINAPINPLYQGELVRVEVDGDEALKAKKATLKVKMTGATNADGKATVKIDRKFKKDLEEFFHTEFGFEVSVGDDLNANEMEVIVKVKGEGKFKASIPILPNTNPWLTLTAPVGGEIWAENNDIKFTPVDAEQTATDELDWEIFYSLSGSINWNLIASGNGTSGQEVVYDWDTTGVANGVYQVLVEVDDTHGGFDWALAGIAVNNP